MADAVHVSKDVDGKIHDRARAYYHELKAGKTSEESAPELKILVSGVMDDGTPTSIMVKIRPNPLNSRMTKGWKIVAEDRVWEVPPALLEKSRLL